MNATAHMASNGNVGDGYIPGFAGQKSKQKARAQGMDEFIEEWAQSFEQPYGIGQHSQADATPSALDTGATRP